MAWIVGFQSAEAEVSEETEVAAESSWQAITKVWVDRVRPVLYVKPRDWATPVG